MRNLFSSKPQHDVHLASQAYLYAELLFDKVIHHHEELLIKCWVVAALHSLTALLTALADLQQETKTALSSTAAPSASLHWLCHVAD